MRGHLGVRFAQVIPTLLLVSIMVFCLQQLMPGDPALVLAGPDFKEGVNQGGRRGAAASVQYLLKRRWLWRWHPGRAKINKLKLGRVF